MLETEEQDGGTGGKVKFEQGSEKTVDISDSRLYYKVAIGSWKRYHSSGL